VQHTSGSTGSPRGVALLQKNLLGNLEAIVESLGIGPDDRCVSWLPLYHDMGLIGGVLTPLFAGGSAIMIASEEFVMRPALWLEVFTKRGGTWSTAPNFGYQLCTTRIPDEALTRFDLRGWRLALNGAEPVRAETLDAFAARFATCGFRREAFLPVYGLAETSLAATFPRRGRGPRLEVVDAEALRGRGEARPPAPGAPTRTLVSVGVPFPGHEVRVVDTDGRSLPERREGEIVLRGPSVMVGYHGDEAATARTLRDGWLHTGDLGFFADGELFVTGRLKAVLIRGGEKHHAEDLERAAERVGDVRQGCSAAFAVETPRGEDVVVVVERSAKATVEPSELARRVAEQIRRAEGIAADAVHVTTPGQVPKTSSGKIQRERCRASLRAGSLELLGSWVGEHR
jgi:acyl-CoA synthetase (AMP-forming)/AMP-acid ligase II